MDLALTDARCDALSARAPAVGQHKLLDRSLSLSSPSACTVNEAQCRWNDPSDACCAVCSTLSRLRVFDRVWLGWDLDWHAANAAHLSLHELHPRHIRQNPQLPKPLDGQYPREHVSIEKDVYNVRAQGLGCASFPNLAKLGAHVSTRSAMPIN